jgi:hypothetical protein
MAKSNPLSIDDPSVMARYFHRYYGDADAASLGAALEQARDKACFQDIAKEFRMIADYCQDVFVPWDDASRASIRELDAIGTLTAELRRKLQRYVVGLTPGEFLKAKRAAIRQVRDTNFWICVDGLYKNDLGIVIEPDAMSMVI